MALEVMRRPLRRKFLRLSLGLPRRGGRSWRLNQVALARAERRSNLRDFLVLLVLLLVTANNFVLTGVCAGAGTAFFLVLFLLE